MRKLILIVIVLACVKASFAQTKGGNNPVWVDFYGIDFTAVNVIGTDETVSEFIGAFKGINELIIPEIKKYNVGKYLGLEIDGIAISFAISQLKDLKDGRFRDKESSDIEISDVVAPYPIVDGNVLLIIAKELNKTLKVGSFIVVVFDGKTKELISEKFIRGSAKGFGLRNYWAGALFNGLKEYRP